MPCEYELDDDYVARLLAEDAKRTSHNYATRGLSALLPKRRAAELPKPNTRFLSHIVREADNHNAALKRKEEQESERRLRALRDRDAPPRKRRRVDESDQRKRSRMLDDVLGAAHSRHDGEHHGAVTNRPHSGRESHHRLGSKDKHTHTHTHEPRDRHGHADDTRRSSRKRRSSSSDTSRLRKDMSPKAIKSVHENVHVQRRRRHSNASPLTHGTVDDGDMQGEGTGVGPTRKRGRGAHRARPGIDDHFTNDYDPSQDVLPESDDAIDAGDWDLALEAMRDRAKWKRNQASRMREAGFGESDISKWEKGFHDHDQEDNLSSVKWSRKGEVREWDAGKTPQ